MDNKTCLKLQTTYIYTHTYIHTYYIYIAEFSCVPPHNEEEKTVDPDELSTTNTKLLNNYF